MTRIRNAMFSYSNRREPAQHRSTGWSSNKIVLHLWTVLKQENWLPWNIYLVEELSVYNPERRMQFCQQWMNMCVDNPLQVTNISLSKEQQNCKYRTKQNAPWTREHHIQYPQEVNRSADPIFWWHHKETKIPSNNNLEVPDEALYNSCLQMIPSSSISK